MKNVRIILTCISSPVTFSKLNAPGKEIARGLMIGVVVDFRGHRRIIPGGTFALGVGSQEKHEQMTEKAVRINEMPEARWKN